MESCGNSSDGPQAHRVYSVMREVKKAFVCFVLVCVLAGFAVGCQGPRTGEYYQYTKAGSSGYCEGLISAGQIPVIGWFVFLPIGATLWVTECCVINPVYDTLMLPYDACQRNHGHYIRVLDENGRPVPHAEIFLHAVDTSGFPVYSGVTDEGGLFYVNRLSYLPSWMEIKANGFHAFRGSVICDGHRDGDYLHGKNWIVDEKGRLAYEVRIFRQHRPVIDSVKQSNFPWSATDKGDVAYDYDLKKGDWMPPEGHGEHADVSMKRTGDGCYSFEAHEGTELFICDRRFDIDESLFSTDYEVPTNRVVHRSIHLQGTSCSHLRVAGKRQKFRDYIAYRVRRQENGAEVSYYGSIVPVRCLGYYFYIFSNIHPNDSGLEPENGNE